MPLVLFRAFKIAYFCEIDWDIYERHFKKLNYPRAEKRRQKMIRLLSSVFELELQKYSAELNQSEFLYEAQECLRKRNQNHIRTKQMTTMVAPRRTTTSLLFKSTF